MQMRGLAIFGITGRTGHALGRAAVGRGMAVRGFARPGSLMPADLGAIKIVVGTFEDPARVLETVAGTDAVCCVFGPRPPYTEAFCASATDAIIHAMREAGVRRLLCQTGAMIGPGNRTPAFALLARSVARRQPEAADDRLEQERLVQESGLQWTLVKPPRLTHRAAGHAVQADPALRVGLFSRIGRSDLASFILDAIEHEQFVGTRVFVRG